ncbi:hypothetical protein ACE3MS_17000 [Paenibacillus dendritiformis]|uniref:hypothetical protein n=1 Tax=Paenibacillus dendritiformis TaxID=130049 RepID=UPI0036533AC9
MKQDGTVYSWDKPDRGKQVKLTRLPQLQKVEKIRIGDNGQHMALTSDGTVWQWSRNVYEKDSMPEQVKGLPKIVDVEPYSRSFFFISEHFDLWTLASTPTSDPVPEALDLNSNIIGIYKNVTKVKRGDGSFTPHYLIHNEAEPDSKLSGIIAAEMGTIGSRDGHTLAFGADGSLLAWGNNAYGQLGIGQPNLLLFHPKPVKGIAHAELVAAGRIIRWP